VGWLHSEVQLGDALVIKKFEERVKETYINGLHGIMWHVFKPMYLLPAPFLSFYTHWGETNLPPAVVTTFPSSTTKAILLGQEIDHFYPTLALGYTTGCNVCMLTYVEGGNFSIRVSKEIIATKDLLDSLVHRYMHEELETMYQNALKLNKEKESSQTNKGKCEENGCSKDKSSTLSQKDVQISLP